MLRLTRVFLSDFMGDSSYTRLFIPTTIRRRVKYIRSRSGKRRPHSKTSRNRDRPFFDSHVLFRSRKHRSTASRTIRTGSRSREDVRDNRTIRIQSRNRRRAFFFGPQTNRRYTKRFFVVSIQRWTKTSERKIRTAPKLLRRTTSREIGSSM